MIEECSKGVLKAQEKLYKKFYNYGMSIAIRYAHNTDTAGEIYNDSFLKVLKNCSRFNGEKSYKAWLRKIIVHTAIDNYRKEIKQENPIDPFDYKDAVSQTYIIEKLVAEDIIRLIHGLPHIYRIVFSLYELEGYSHEEIASKLNLSVSTSRSCLSRAKSKLRHLIAVHHEIKKK